MIDTITDEIAAEVIASLTETRVITSVEQTARRLTIHFGPKLCVAAKRVLDAEAEVIRKFCNAPFSMYCDDSMYRFTLTCN